MGPVLRSAMRNSIQAIKSRTPATSVGDTTTLRIEAQVRNFPSLTPILSRQFPITFERITRMLNAKILDLAIKLFFPTVPRASARHLQRRQPHRAATRPVRPMPCRHSAVVLLNGRLVSNYISSIPGSASWMHSVYRRRFKMNRGRPSQCWTPPHIPNEIATVSFRAMATCLLTDFGTENVNRCPKTAELNSRITCARPTLSTLR
jgi:hypothetical protein